MREDCVVCEQPITMQVMKNTGLCSGRCRKIKWAQDQGIDLTETRV